MLLTICLTDGRQYPFTIADGPASAEFLKGVRYWEIFDRPILRINDRKDTWAFNPNAIEKLTFETPEDPGWQLSENILAAKCIAPESYQRKLAALEATSQRSAPSSEAGAVYESALSLTLASGAVEYFECMLMLRARRERMINLYQLFQKIAHAIPCEGGGFVLLNPANIVCIHMHPSPPEDADSAWLVDAFTGKEPEPRAAGAASAQV